MQSNSELADFLKTGGWIRTARVEKTFRETDRARFVPQEMRNYAYADQPLPTGEGQTISAPDVVALTLEALDVRAGAKVLDVGSGSGYQTALIAHIVGKRGKVVAIERIPSLLKYAQQRVSAKNVRFVLGDGSLGFKEEAPYDRVVVAAACPSFPKPLLEQLKTGGKIVAPVGGRWRQDLLLGVKEKDSLRVLELLPVIFVPLVGKESFGET